MIVARIDRTVNDVPMVIRFQSYPTLLLFRAGAKYADSSADGGEVPSQRGLHGSRGFASPLKYETGSNDPNQCSRPLQEEAVLDWIRQHVAQAKPQLMGNKNTNKLNEY